LQHTATHSDTLQHAATHCNTLQHPLNTLLILFKYSFETLVLLQHKPPARTVQHIHLFAADPLWILYCSTYLQHIQSSTSSRLQQTLFEYSINTFSIPWLSKEYLKSIKRVSKGCCSVLQRVAACCSVLQRVAVCCRRSVFEYSINHLSILCYNSSLHQIHASKYFMNALL